MDTALKITGERFSEGLTIDEFRNGMSKNREQFEANYQGFSLTPEDRARLKELAAPLNVAVLAEDWCGDVIRYLPIFVRMAEEVGSWNVRIFYRDANPDLADRCLKEGKYRAIPVFLFHDQEMNECACFTERPEQVYTAENEAKRVFAEMYPDLADASAPTGEMAPTTYDLYVAYIRAFRAENQARWQQMFVEDIIGRLQAACVGAAA